MLETNREREEANCETLKLTADGGESKPAKNLSSSYFYSYMAADYTRSPIHQQQDQ